MSESVCMLQQASGIDNLLTFISNATVPRCRDLYKAVAIEITSGPCGSGTTKWNFKLRTTEMRFMSHSFPCHVKEHLNKTLLLFHHVVYKGKQGLNLGHLGNERI